MPPQCNAYSKKNNPTLMKPRGLLTWLLFCVPPRVIESDVALSEVKKKYNMGVCVTKPDTAVMMQMCEMTKGLAQTDYERPEEEVRGLTRLEYDVTELKERAETIHHKEMSTMCKKFSTSLEYAIREKKRNAENYQRKLQDRQNQEKKLEDKEKQLEDKERQLEGGKKKLDEKKRQLEEVKMRLDLERDMLLNKRRDEQYDKIEAINNSKLQAQGQATTSTSKPTLGGLITDGATYVWNRVVGE